MNVHRIDGKPPLIYPNIQWKKTWFPMNSPLNQANECCGTVFTEAYVSCDAPSQMVKPAG